jgi:protein-S-isoprenylcysteine O-methyltransferase Ste14
VALVAASELFLRMAGMARLSRYRDLAALCVGLGELVGARFHVLVYATGVPPLEAQMLRSRGERYRDYQARTSIFFPLPPRGQGPKGELE